MADDSVPTATPAETTTPKIRPRPRPLDLTSPPIIEGEDARSTTLKMGMSDSSIPLSSFTQSQSYGFSSPSAHAETEIETRTTTTAMSTPTCHDYYQDHKHIYGHVCDHQHATPLTTPPLSPPPPPSPSFHLRPLRLTGFSSHRANLEKTRARAREHEEMELKSLHESSIPPTYAESQSEQYAGYFKRLPHFHPQRFSRRLRGLVGKSGAPRPLTLDLQVDVRGSRREAVKVLLERFDFGEEESEDEDSDSDGEQTDEEEDDGGVLGAVYKVLVAVKHARKAEEEKEREAAKEEEQWAGKSVGERAAEEERMWWGGAVTGSGSASVGYMVVRDEEEGDVRKGRALKRREAWAGMDQRVVVVGTLGIILLVAALIVWAMASATM